MNLTIIKSSLRNRRENAVCERVTWVGRDVCICAVATVCHDRGPADLPGWHIRLAGMVGEAAVVRLDG